MSTSGGHPYSIPVHLRFSVLQPPAEVLMTLRWSVGSEDEQESEDRQVPDEFVEWCSRNHLLLRLFT